MVGMRGSMLSRPALKDPHSHKGQITNTPCGSAFLQPGKMRGVQPQGDKFLFRPDEFYIDRSKLIQEVSSTVVIPKPTFFFKRFKLGDFIFHGLLPPFIKVSFGLRHRPGSDYFCLILAKINEYYGQVASALRLAQNQVSIVFSVQDIRTAFETDLFNFFWLNSMFCYMQDCFIVPYYLFYSQCFTSPQSIYRNTKDVKSNFIFMVMCQESSRK